MPPIFKALATISAWILFVGGCINIIITLVTLPIGGVTEREWMHTAAFLGVAVISIALSTVVMKLRKELE